MAHNVNRMSKKQWRKWSPKARAVFNNVYGFMVDNPDLMRNPKQPAVSPYHWKTTAWNAAWIAADAVDDNIPDELLEVA